jgi:hypothetical protein
MGPRAGLDDVKTRKIFCCRRKSKPYFPVFQPIVTILTELPRVPNSLSDRNVDSYVIIRKLLVMFFKLG